MIANRYLLGVVATVVAMTLFSLAYGYGGSAKRDGAAPEDVTIVDSLTSSPGRVMPEIGRSSPRESDQLEARTDSEVRESAVAQSVDADDWWRTLSRRSSGWLVHVLPVSAKTLSKPEKYVRSVDLNPRDVPLTRAQVDKLSAMVESWQSSLETIVDAQSQCAIDGLNKLVSEGKLPPITVGNLDGKQRAKHRGAVRAVLRQKGKLSGDNKADKALVGSASDRVKRIAMLNMLGHEYGIVQDAGAGVYFAASVGDIPAASFARQGLFLKLGEYWIAVIGSMTQWGTLTAQEGGQLAAECWQRLGLPG